MKITAELVGGPRCGVVTQVPEDAEIVKFGPDVTYYAFCLRGATKRRIYLYSTVYDFATGGWR